MSSWEPMGSLALVSAPPFGWWIAAYFTLAALASGLVLRSAVACVFGGGSGAATALRKACLWALVAVGLGGVCLIADLASPSDFLLTLTHFNSDSWISIGSRILGLFGVLCLVALAVIPDEESGDASPKRVLPLLLILAALGLAIYPALVLMQATGRPLWDSTLLPAIFLVSACHLGISLGSRLSGLAASQGMAKVITGIELALVAAFVFSKSDLVFAQGTWVIWIAAYLACSFVVPALGAGPKAGRVGASSWLVLVGTFVFRYWLLKAGQSPDAFFS